MVANFPLNHIVNWIDYRFRIEFWAILGCVLLFVALVELVRRQKLKERYSLLWFLTIAVLCSFSLRRNWLDDLAQWLGVYYPPTALFLMLVFFMLLILVHFSTVVSGLLDDKQRLAQRIGLLEARISRLELGINEESIRTGENISKEDSIS